MDGDPFAFRYRRLIDQRAKRGDKPAAEARSFIKPDVIRQANEVYVRMVNRDELSKRPPVREARLCLFRADLVIS